MTIDWFKPRGYRHFDAQIGEQYAIKVADEGFVERHAWLPLIRYQKRVKRYKPKLGKTVFKQRPIMYASHRDSCILSKYAWDLSKRLDAYYERKGLDRNVIAYRRLGKSNYHFSAEAFQFAKSRPGCVVLCFDISGFFDNLDHRILKRRLKFILEVEELGRDWFAVFRHVTRFSTVDKSALAAHPRFSSQLSGDSREPIATIAEVKLEGIPILVNDERFGIPQGTPISSALSNLYMLELDERMVECCRRCGALYQRYSDDILIVCNIGDEVQLRSAFLTELKKHQLEINEDKTERVVFGSVGAREFQYLGFNISAKGAAIRPGSLARQWRKAKRSIARTKRIGRAEMALGNATKIYTKKLRKRFYPVGSRNFSSYARRSASVFESKQMLRQVLRFERMIDAALRSMDDP
ncbi:putative Reverse transcriptase [Bradyrhizobium sp. ORS 278]|uniref:reverse transcriptase/maturase family protein n=1 Tax=Bradyrhizobium sp. (strain ORS 278) TaxID=114615 RepID=UPI0001508ACC|nr:reverse transcriptase/maturase family protein [Bradyrhizobium sp. ORS 278]CAL78901.1 putative Reverse transcriptase [Bradyrhizobium sp. ORS 278]